MTYIFSDLSKTLKLSFPMMLGQFVAISMSFIDTAMLGRGVGTESLAALGFAINITQILAVTGFGLSAAVTILTSQAWGADKKNECIHILRHGFVLVSCYAFMMISILYLLMENISYVHYLGQRKEIVLLAKPYIYLIATSFIFTYYNACTRSYCQAQNVVWFPLIIMSSTILINIALNWLLIFGKFGLPQLGIIGAGIGSLLSQIIGFILISLLLHTNRRFTYNLKKLYVWDFHVSLFKKLTFLGIPICLDIFGEILGFAILALFVGHFGDTALAAHHGSLEVSMVLFVVVMSTCDAVSIRTGQANGNRGENQKHLIKKSSYLFSIVIGIPFTIIPLIYHHQLPYIFTRDSEVIRISSQIFIFIACYQFADIFSLISTGMLNGISDVKAPMIASLIGKLIFMVPFAYIMGFMFNYKVPGIWSASLVGTYITALILSWRVHKKIP